VSSVGFSLRRQVATCQAAGMQESFGQGGVGFSSRRRSLKERDRVAAKHQQSGVLFRWRRLKPTLLSGGFFA